MANIFAVIEYENRATSVSNVSSYIAKHESEILQKIVNDAAKHGELKDLIVTLKHWSKCFTPSDEKLLAKLANDFGAKTENICNLASDGIGQYPQELQRIVNMVNIGFRTKAL